MMVAGARFVRWMAAALVAICALHSTPALADSERLVTVSIQEVSDADGSPLVFLMTEKFRASPRFRVETDAKKSDYQLKISTLIAKQVSESLTVYAVTVTDHGFLASMTSQPSLEIYGTQFVGYCGANVMETCALHLFGDIGGYIDRSQQARSWVARAVFGPPPKKP